jgi:type IV secretory pathway VirB2 component (pilin)
VGVICVCIGGFFGNINWKWLTAIVVGLVVISMCTGFIELFTPDGSAPDLKGY